MIKKLWENKLIRQIIRFGIVGGLAFIIDYGVYALLTQVFSVYYILASVISFSLSVIFNYILSITWVFDVNKKQGVKEFIVFIVLSVIGLLLNSLILYLSVELLHIHELIGKIIATIIVMIYNFITRKIFIEKWVNT